MRTSWPLGRHVAPFYSGIYTGHFHKTTITGVCSTSCRYSASEDSGFIRPNDDFSTIASENGISHDTCTGTDVGTTCILNAGITAVEISAHEHRSPTDLTTSINSRVANQPHFIAKQLNRPALATNSSGLNDPISKQGATN